MLKTNAVLERDKEVVVRLLLCAAVSQLASECNSVSAFFFKACSFSATYAFFALPKRN